jgi:hypothetical protein
MEIQSNQSINNLLLKNNTSYPSTTFTTFNNTKTHLSFKKPVGGPVLNDKCCKNQSENEYSLIPHFFDPNHHSPPNDFLLKIQSRLNQYYKKESNLFNE